MARTTGSGRYSRGNDMSVKRAGTRLGLGRRLGPASAVRPETSTMKRCFPFLVFASLMAAANAYRDYSPRISSGRTRELEWNSPFSTAGGCNAGGVPIDKEIQLLNSGQLLRRGEFGPLSPSRLIQVASCCYDIGMPLHQASSIRKQLLIQKVTSGSWLLKDEGVVDDIADKFCRERSILKLAYEYDLPPVSILRCIIKKRVKDASPHIIRRYGGTHRLKQITMMVIHEQHQNYLSDILTSSWERRQLQIAKAHDSVGYQVRKVEKRQRHL